MDNIYESLPEYLLRTMEEQDAEVEAEGPSDLAQVPVNLAADLAKSGPSVALYILQLRGEQELIKNEEKRLAARRKALERREEWLKGLLREAMSAEDMKKLPDPRVTCTRKMNPVKCVIEDEAALSDEWIETRVEKVVKKADLIAHYKSTGEVPDGVTFSQSEGLLIR